MDQHFRIASKSSRLTRAFLFFLCAALSSQILSSDSPSPTPSFSLADLGSEFVVDYAKYGHFENEGTPDYRYAIDDREGLAKAVGEGIFPNEFSLNHDAAYRKYTRLKRLEGPLESYKPEANPQLAFYKWASMKGIPHQGLRLYNIARSLELGGLDKHALKAYYAVVVHFPREITWVHSNPWYVGVAALDAVQFLLDRHPEWNWRLEDARIDVQNGFDKKATNDVFLVNPGRWTRGRPVAQVADLGTVKAQRGGKFTRVVQRENNHWQFIVDEKPYFIRGMCYTPTQVGRSPDFDGYKPHTDWLHSDLNRNNKIDSPYDSWVDKNKNNQKDGNELIKGDFQLMKEMGVNTVRLYHHAYNKELLRDLKDRYGIRVVMGDFLGAYTVGSGAVWEEGTDYSNQDQRDRMRESVKDMVSEHKDEKYVLMWVLGNENNYGHGSNANKNPSEYYKFVNTIARMVHLLDPSRPVALCNGDIENLDIIARECPEVDVLAINAYRGAYGMGESFWRSLENVWKKPVLISEFGCPAYSQYHSPQEIEELQAQYLLANWQDVVNHSAGYRPGLAIGAMIFEWVDEWWKSGPRYEATVQDTDPQSKGPFPDGNIYEEWLGLASQGDGSHSPYLRQLRIAFHKFKNGGWKDPVVSRQELSQGLKSFQQVEAEGE